MNLRTIDSVLSNGDALRCSEGYHVSEHVMPGTYSLILFSTLLLCIVFTTSGYAAAHAGPVLSWRTIVAFKVNDLMIHLLSHPAAGGGCGPGSAPIPQCAGCTGTCNFCSSACTQGCTGTCLCSHSCHMGGRTLVVSQNCIAANLCGGTGDPGLDGPGVINAETLIALKHQLQQQLAQVEALQAAVEESQKPQTVEEVDVLEQRLTAALGELKTRRDEIQKASDAKK